MWWERHRGLDQSDDFVARREATSIGRYQATSVKLMMDGVLENFTGAMLEPYGDGAGGTTDNRGLLQVDPEVLATALPRLDTLGFQPHFHAIGDRAVRASLDAVEAARRANGPSDTRPVSPTSRSSTRTTSAGSGRSTWRPTRSRTGPSTRARWTS